MKSRGVQRGVMRGIGPERNRFIEGAFTRDDNTPYFPWDWESEFTLTNTAPKIYESDYDPEADAPVISSGNLGYWKPNGGNDGTGVANDAAHPWLTLAAMFTAGIREVVAIGTPNFRNFYFADRGNGLAASFNGNYNWKIRPDDGITPIIITRALASPSWAQESAPNDNVWSTTLPSSTADPAAVLDFTYGINGVGADEEALTGNEHFDGKVYPEEFLIDGETQVPIPYSHASSIEDCQATPNSWYRNGATLYVHTWDSRAPDADLKVLSADNVTAIISTAQHKIYSKKTEFWGKQCFRWAAGAAAGTCRMIGVDSASRYNVLIANAGDCWDLDNVEGRFTRCVATDAQAADGFNYHRNVAYNYYPNHFEQNCYAARNGYNAPDLGINDQGFTIHDRSRMIRIGCVGRGNYSQNFSDGLGSNLIVLGCTSYYPNGAGTSNLGFSVGSSSGPVLSAGYYKDNTSFGANHADFSQSTGGYAFDLGGNQGDHNPMFRGTWRDGRIRANQDAVFVPVFTVPPSISGIAAEGRTISVNTGTVTGYGPCTFEYQALLKDPDTLEVTEITGETANSFIADSDAIGFLPGYRVKAINFLGNAETEIEVFGSVEIASDTTTPDTFDFINVSNIPEDTLTTSNIAQVTGFSAAIDISVSGDGSPEFRLYEDAGGTIPISAWGSAPVNIDPGDYTTVYAQVRATSSDDSGGIATIILTAGTGGADWRIVSEDSSALDFFAAIEATGATISDINKTALANFVGDLRGTFSADGISYWDALASINLFGCGIDGIVDGTTLGACFIPLKGPNPTNANFVFGDHAAKVGLTSDGSTKAVNTNYNYGATDKLVIGAYLKSATMTGGQDPWGNKQGQDSSACDFVDLGGGNKITMTFLASGGQQRSLSSTTNMALNTWYLVAHQLNSTDSVGLYQDGVPDADFISMDGFNVNTPTTGLTVFRDIVHCAMSCGLFFSGPADWEPADHLAFRSFVVDLMNVLTVDSTPAGLSFTDVEDADLETQYAADATVTSFDGTLAATVQSGPAEIRKNDTGTWGASVNVVSGDEINTRMTSSDVGLTPVSAIIALGTETALWTITTSDVDISPAGLAFSDVTGSEISTLQTANATVSAFDGPLLATVDTGTAEIRKNSTGTWGSSVSVDPGDTINARMTSSGSFATALSSDITLGSATDTWSVTTRAADTTPAGLSFTDVTGATVSTQYTANATVSAFDGPLNATVDTGTAEIRKNSTGSWGTSVSVSAGDTINARMTSSGTSGATVSSNITLGTVTDTWSVQNTVTYNSAASTYFSTIASNGGTITDPKKQALSDLMDALDSNSFTSRIKYFQLLSGIGGIGDDTELANCLKRLVIGAQTVTMNNFVLADYSEQGGLAGDGSSKYVNTGYNWGASKTGCNVMLGAKKATWTNAQRLFGNYSGTDTIEGLIVVSGGNQIRGTFQRPTPAAASATSTGTTLVNNTRYDLNFVAKLNGGGTDIDLNVYKNGSSVGSNTLGGVTLRTPTTNIELFRSDVNYFGGNLFYAIACEDGWSAAEISTLQGLINTFLSTWLA